MRSTPARVLLAPPHDDDRFLPEGPRWLHRDGHAELVWVNIQTEPDATTGSIHSFRLSPPPHPVARPAPGRPGFALPATQQRLFVGLTKELRICNLADGSWSPPLAVIPDANPSTIINDAEVVPGGTAVVFGTKDTQFKESIAHLYLYTVDDNRVSLLADQQLCSNGKVFRQEAGGLILFDIDTPTRKVVRYRLDLAARTATPDGVALDLTNQIGFPDGMCDCGDGTVIIAFYNPDFAEAGKAIRFDLVTGQALEEWTTPGSPRVTCPLLVQQPDGVKLILTTATEGMPADLRAKCPTAGCLFIADTQFATCHEPELVRLPG
jgi:sugar lactone lactonase YvrE